MELLNKSSFQKRLRFLIITLSNRGDFHLIFSTIITLVLGLNSMNLQSLPLFWLLQLNSLPIFLVNEAKSWIQLYT